jgi:hypothetical protein
MRGLLPLYLATTREASPSISVLILSLDSTREGIRDGAGSAGKSRIGDSSVLSLNWSFELRKALTRERSILGSSYSRGGCLGLLEDSGRSPFENDELRECDCPRMNSRPLKLLYNALLFIQTI